MRHYLLLLLILILGTALFAEVASGDSPAGPVPITVTRDEGGANIFGPLQPGVVPVEPERLDRAPLLSLSPTAHAADFCSSAAPLTMSDGTDGDASTVKGATVSPDDPRLTCMKGAPSSLQGYRTVWYRFEAPASGRLVAWTDFDPDFYRDSYDTVLALYHTGVQNDVALACNNLALIACNDDDQGFLSEVEAFVHQGEWYFIEVAAWHLAAEGYELRLAVVLEEAESLWETWQPPGDDDWFWRLARSRHMVATDGTHIYVISGETVVEEFPEITENVSRLTPATGEWRTNLWPVPRPDLPGYSRTSAAYLNGNIYIPSGYVGDDQFYWGEHLRYTVAADEWNYATNGNHIVLAPVPGEPYAWAQAVAAPARRGYYLTGGLLAGDPDPSFPSDAEPTANLYFYSAQADTWNTNLPSMDTPRYAHVAARLDTSQGEKICVAGGIGKAALDAAELLDSAECYSRATNSWTPIAPLNRARFSAGSAVGPDGRWYVFGGATVSACGTNSQCFVPETITEVYDPAANSWTMLDARYSLDEPGRAWPRGVFVGNDLWILGGETVGTTPPSQVVPLIQRLTALPPRSSNAWATDGLFLPVVSTLALPKTTIEPNDIFADAQPLPMNQTVQGDFANVDDFFDVYRFEVTTPGYYEGIVSSIPVGHNYDLYMYGENKYRVAYGENIGNNDEVARTLYLHPGTYYAMVVRVFGDATADKYNIMVRPQ